MRSRRSGLVATLAVFVAACSSPASNRAAVSTDPTTPPTEVTHTTQAAKPATTTVGTPTTTTRPTTPPTGAPTTITSPANAAPAVTIGGPVASVSYATAPDTIPQLTDRSGKPYPPPVITGIDGFPRLPLVATSVQNPNIRPLTDPKHQPIIDAYLAFETVDTAVQGTYPVNPDDPRLATVIAPDELTGWRNEVYAPQRDHGDYWIFPLGLTFRPAVGADATESRAIVYDCTWTSGYQVDHATGQPTADMHPTLLPNQRAVADLTVPHVDPSRAELVNHDGRWLVATVTRDWTVTCADLDK